MLLNPKDHPDAKIGDVVEIYHPEDDGVRLLLQITSLKEDRNRGKGIIYKRQKCNKNALTNLAVKKLHLCSSLDYISIESSIAATFNFATYSEVVMRKIDPASVALDSVEITFKDQYLGRSEMWRLKTSLVRSKKVHQMHHFHGQIYSCLCVFSL